MLTAPRLTAERPSLGAPDARFRAILEIARALGTTLDLDELLRLLMSKITELLDAERSTLFLVDRERDELWSKVAQGPQQDEIRLPLGRGLAGFVAETGRTVNVKDAYEDPRFNADIDRLSGFQTNSMLAVPLRGKDGSVIGVAQALNKRSAPSFSPDDERTLASVANLIGIALENAQLYSAVRAKNLELESTQAKLRQKVAEVDLLFEIEREISASAALEPMLEAILDRAMATVFADAGAVLLLDEGGGQVIFKRAPGAAVEQRPVHGRSHEGVLATVLDEARALLVNDGRATGGALLELVGTAPRTLVCAPLVFHGRGGENRVFGALELADKMTGDFTDDDLKLASLVAAQVARAVTLARSRAESERAGRLAALGQMLGGIVHDLRGPMTVIGGYSELMSRESRESEREKYTAQILSQLDHVNGMTREVLAFVRGDRQLLVRRVFVAQFWQDLEVVLSRELDSRQISLTVENGYTGTARFDENKIRRLVTNLARNAAQAMTQGGCFRIGCHVEGDVLVMRFEDNGSGIPPEVAARMFTAFNSHSKAGGTGLGLAIVKEVVDAHGGEVSFSTEVAKGTTFTVRLPGSVIAR